MNVNTQLVSVMGLNPTQGSSKDGLALACRKASLMLCALPNSLWREHVLYNVHIIKLLHNGYVSIHQEKI